MNNRYGINSKYIAIILTIVCVFTFFIHNGVLVPDIMESRNIITAREMVYDGNWLITTMNGDLRFEKPPLPTWLTAVTEYISADNICLQRGMAGLAGCLLVVAFYLIGLAIFDKDKTRSFISTLILCTCYSVLLIGRTASWDIYTHAFMLMGIWFMIRGFQRPKKFASQFFWAGVFTGLSIMSKGPISLYGVLLPWLLVFILFCLPKMKGKWGSVLMMILVAAVVGGWWYIYVYAFHSDAVASVLAKETGNWTSYTVKPWYYYWDFFLETGIWTLLMITALLMMVWSPKERGSREYLFPFMWLVASLILLSLVPEKKTRYLLPVMLPSAYLMGYLVCSWQEKFDSRKEQIIDRILYHSNVWILAVLIGALPIAVFFFAVKPGYMGIVSFIITTLVCFGVAYLLARASKLYKPTMMVTGVVLLFMGIELFAMPAARYIVNNPEMNSLSQTYDMPELDNIPFRYNSKDELRIEMVYAAKRKIRPLDVDNLDSLKAALPCVILTHKSAKEELNPELFSYADTMFVGHFDDNPRPSGNRLNRPIFVYNLNLLVPKE